MNNGPSSTFAKSVRNMKTPVSPIPAKIKPSTVPVTECDNTGCITYYRDKTNYDIQLLDMGYHTQQHLILYDDDSSKQIFIRCKTPSGIHLYVRLDSEGIISSHGQPIELKNQSNSIETFPTYDSSIENGVYTENKVDTAFICSQGLCIVSASNHEEPNRKIYKFVNKTDLSEIISDENNVVTLPVINFAELVNHPQLVYKSLVSASNRLRSKMQQKYNQDMETYFDIFSDLQNNSKRLHQLYSEINEDITFNLRENYDITSNKMSHFLSISSQLQDLVSDINYLNLELVKINEELEDLKNTPSDSTEIIL